jgi:hypothetical protein
MKYFVIADPATTESFMLSVDGLPTEYATEAAAVAAAKEYSVDCYVVKATSSVIPVERHKVTKLA